MNDKPIYNVISTHEIPELSKIEVSNITSEITLAGTLQSLEYNKKQIEAIEAEIKLKEALITNVVTNYPDVVNIDEKMQIACHTYYEAGRYVKIGKEKLEEFKKAQEALEEEVEQIKIQTGIEKMTVEEKLKLNLKKNLTEKKDDKESN